MTAAFRICRDGVGFTLPGHTPGHISLWRERDRTIIAGDAFITTNQESAYAVAVQAEEMHGPPKYFTPDWSAAKSSVQRLAALEPDVVVTGHGRAMRGPRCSRLCKSWPATLTGLRFRISFS